MFLFNRKHGLIDALKRHYFNRKGLHTFAPRPLIFKLQQEVLKINDTFVSWSSSETDLKRNFFYT